MHGGLQQSSYAIQYNGWYHYSHQQSTRASAGDSTAMHNTTDADATKVSYYISLYIRRRLLSVVHELSLLVSYLLTRELSPYS